MKLKLLFTLLFVGVSITSYSQTLISSAGGTLFSENISLNFSAGDVFTTSFSGSSVTLSGGFVGITDRILTSSEVENPDLPIQFDLSQNYPNPFNPSTNIQFSLPKTSDVKLEVFNSIGVLVATLIDDQKQAGFHTVRFDASRYSSGMYFYRLIANNAVVSTKKMILIK
ncbi:MAG: T9SS type A sorting domain-containing protein [Balneolaceae bacterium]